ASLTVSTTARKPLRAAVIGTGGVGQLRHIPAMREAEALGLAELVALCDPSEESLRSAGDRFGVATRYADYRRVIGRDDVDVVTIATPNSSHEEISVAALEAGKHVLCEKPLALSYAAARRMEEAAGRSGRRTSVNFRYRWVPSARYVKELVESGEVGEVHQLFMNYFNASVQDPDRPIPSRQTPRQRPGRRRSDPLAADPRRGRRAVCRHRLAHDRPGPLAGRPDPPPLRAAAHLHPGASDRHGRSRAGRRRRRGDGAAGVRLRRDR